MILVYVIAIYLCYVGTAETIERVPVLHKIKRNADISAVDLKAAELVRKINTAGKLDQTVANQRVLNKHLKRFCYIS